MEQYPEYFKSQGPLVFMTDKKEDAVNPESLTDYIATLSEEEKMSLKDTPKYMYQVTFEKPGGLVLPLIVEMTYADGTKERQTFPAQIWMKNDEEAKRVFATTKEVINFTVDPDLETADIDMSNNSWPKKQESKFDTFKEKIKD